MNVVEPIRDKKKLNAIRANLRKSPRNYLLFVFGINVALRIGDLLRLRIKDIMKEDGETSEYLYVKEQKTGRQCQIKLNESVREAIEYYLENAIVNSRNQYVFKGRRTENPIDRFRVHKLIKKWTRDVGLQGRYSTHSLRKTWGYQARQMGVPIELIQEKLGHRSPAVTRRYIGITQEEVNNIEEKVCL